MSMDAEKSARAREERVVFFQSSNLLNLFFPRNVAAVSKLLIAIGKVESMGWEGSRIERGRKGREGGLKGDRRVYEVQWCEGAGRFGI